MSCLKGSKEQQRENETCVSGLYLSAPMQEEKVEPKHKNVNSFFSFQGRPLRLVSFFTSVFKVWERTFLQFLSEQVKHQYARNKMWRQYFLEIRVDGWPYDNQTSKKVKNTENSYNFRWKRNERFSISNRDSKEAQCPYHD